MKKLKSEIGAKAAWDGFSSQTIYIASRLLNETEKLDFYPESIEDLMLKDENEIIELIQVKNYNSDLTLSDFKPQEEDSFLKRVLKYRSDKLIAKVISFGNIGEELKGALNKETKYITSISNKLSDYGYNSEDIEWLLQHLIIERVNEKKLKEDIYEKLKDNFSISTSISVFFSYLISYINTLSRNSEKTNKETWDKIVYNIIESLVSIDSIHKQYGRTLFSLSSFTTNKSIEEQKEEYKNGFDAKPYYIKNNLDIYREKWISEIEESFKNNNVVLIRGLSGQGKSSIAYRYLIDNYNENCIFIVKNLSDFKEAKDIISVLEGLSINSYCESILYLDIKPYDKSWKIILDHIKDKETKIKILITIREEDYKRSNISSNLYDYGEIELTLEKEEAEEIYNNYGSDYFINFEEAWKKFGEKGPFMEFIYLLSKNEMLVEKLENQIDNIIENEENSDEWLRFLLIVSLAGKDNFSININKITEVITVQNFSKILKNTQKEYLIELDEGLNKIQSTHALRASILVNIIVSKIAVDKEKMIIDTIECTKEYYPTLVVEYIKKSEINIDNLVKKINEYDNIEWSSYSSLIRAMLWYDTYSMYIKNFETISYCNTLCNNNFILLFLGDVTDITGFDRVEHIELLKQINPEMTTKIMSKVDFNEFIIDYYNTDLLCNKIIEKIVNKKILSSDNYSYIGYVLFWLGIRKIFLKKINYFSLDYSKSLEIEDLLIGLKQQKLDREYNIIAKELISRQIRQNKIVEIKENDEISVKFINNIYDSKNNNFNKVMKIVNFLRRTYCGKKKYNVKMIGEKICDEIETMDSEKSIANKNLQLSWVTDINSQLTNIDGYNNGLDNWEKYKAYIEKECELIYRYVNKFNIALDYYYRKGNSKKIDSNEFNIIRKQIKDISIKLTLVPKCDTNIYGVDNTLFSLRNDNEENQSNETKLLITRKLRIFINNMENFFMQYISAIKSKIDKKNDRIEFLSVCNIIEATNSYIDFVIEYKKQFKDNELINNLTEELKVLSCFWKSFIEQPFIYNKSKLYEVKEQKKKKEKKFKKFIDDNIEINKIIENDKEYCKIEFERFGDYFKELFDYFSKVDRYSYDGILLNEYDLNNKLYYLYTIDKKNTHLGCKLKLMSLLYYYTMEEFINKGIIPMSYKDNVFNNIENVDENNVLYNCMLIYGDINDLRSLFNHIISVNSSLNDISEECIEVYNDWKSNIMTSLEKFVDDIIQRCTVIKEAPEMQIILEKIDLFINSTVVMKNSILDIINIKDEKDINIIDDFENNFLSLISK